MGEQRTDPESGRRQASAPNVRIKRAYEEASADDGYRVLVERLWPRGLRKDDLEIDAWLKNVAPSAELRKWYAHDVSRWPEFKRRYQAELRAEPPALAELLRYVRRGNTTLIYAARDEKHNSAVVLRAFLARRLR